jgi:hypothetical protein
MSVKTNTTGSKKTTSTEVSTQVTKAQFAEIAAQTADDDSEAMSKLFAVAKQVNTKELEKIAGDDYFTFEEGETYVLMCRGILKDALPSKKTAGLMVDAVSLQTEDGIQTINADKVLVSTISRMPEGSFPCLIMVHCKGMKRGAAGEYKDLEIWKY